MKPLLILVGALLMSALPWTKASAEDPEVEVTRLTLEHNDGSQSHYDLAEQPELTFDGDQLVITTPLAETKLDRASLSHFHFTRGTASIASVAADDYLFRYVDNKLTIRGQGVKSMKMYDINGMAVMDQPAIDGEINADLSVLKSGVYIVSVSGKPAVKLLVK